MSDSIMISLKGLIFDIRLNDIIDILLVTFIIYWFLSLLRGTRAIRILFGIVVIFILFGIANHQKLYTILWMIDKIVPVALIAFIIIFQPELRRALEQIGRGSIFRGSLAGFRDKDVDFVIDELKKAVAIFSKRKLGALIILERESGLREFIDTGIKIDALMSSELIQSIFEPASLLHDGAIIIQGNRIAAASCFLPLTDAELDISFGTRHRAAVGITEITDSLAIVVSEESGAISFVFNGKIARDIDIPTLARMLHRMYRIPALHLRFNYRRQIVV